MHTPAHSTQNLPKHRIADAAMASALAGILAISLAACSDADKSSNSEPPASSLGNVIDDTVLDTRVKAALMANPQVNSYDFKVETRKGEVLLSGFVNSQAELNLAMDLVQAVDGVKSIQNNVTLKDGPATVGNKVDDGITTAKVKAALLADASIRSMDIRVVTRVDEVQLSGFVNNQQQMDRAMQVAAGVPGVRQVRNEMRVKN
jgi:hyperosmotically inducible protein